MPRASAFNSTHFSSRPSHQEKFYREMVKVLGSGKNYSDDFNSLAMARVYAFSMAFGRAKYQLERAANQFRPRKALELLPPLEREYGLIPEPGSSIAERRSELAVAAWVARGAGRSNVESVLTELFGAAFIQYITIASADAVTTPGDPGTRGVYVKPGARRSVFRVTSAVAATGVATLVTAEIVAGDFVAPALDSRIIIDPGDHGRVEAVTVIGALVVSQTLYLNAIFTKPHNVGAMLATGRHANLGTTKRHNLFLLDAEAVRTNRTRRRLNRAADRLLRGVSTWSLTDGSGPFRVGVGRLGVTTIGALP